MADFTESFRLGLAIAQQEKQAELARQAEGRKLLLGVVENFGDLAKMPKEFRGVAVDSYNQTFQALTGKPMAESLVKMLKSGNDEILQQTFGAMVDLIGADKSLTFDAIAPALAGDPSKLPEVLKSLNDQMVARRNREALGQIVGNIADISTNTDIPASWAEAVDPDDPAAQFLVKMRRLEAARNRALALGDEGRKVAESISKQIEELNERGQRIFKSPENMMAFRLFGKRDAGSLTPEEAEIVRQAIDADNISLKAREAKAVETARELDTPIPRNEAQAHGLDNRITQRQLSEAGVQLPPIEQAKKHQQDYENYRKTLQVADNLQKAIQSTSGASLGPTGWVTRTYNFITGQIDALAQLVGADPNLSRTVLDPNNEAYANFWQQTGIQSSKQRALMVDLAFLAAEANNQTGRAVSEPDVLRFMRQIGAEAGDQQTALTLIQQFKEGLVQRFQSSEETLYSSANRAGLRKPLSLELTVPESLNPSAARASPPKGNITDPNRRARLEELRRKQGGGR